MSSNRLRALVHVPAVVLEPRARARRVVDLLDVSLADVADVEVAREPIEGVAPGVAQAERDDLRRRAGTPHVEAQQLAEQAVHALRSVLGIAAGPAVARPDVETAVRAECEPAPVVVRVRLVDREEDARSRRNGARAVRPVADDARVAVRVRVVHVDESIRRVLRVERETEEALLATRRDPFPRVEEEPGAELSAVDDTDRSALFDDVEPARLAARCGDLHRLDEPPRDDDPPERAFGAEGRSGHRGEHDDATALRRRQAQVASRHRSQRVLASREPKYAKGSCGSSSSAPARSGRPSWKRSTRITRSPSSTPRHRRLQALTARYDVAVFEGDGTSRKDLAAAGVDDADLVIACTSRDEVNLVAGMFARREAEGATTVIRTSSAEYVDALARGAARRRLRRLVRARDGIRDQPHPSACRPPARRTSSPTARCRSASSTSTDDASPRRRSAVPLRDAPIPRTRRSRRSSAATRRSSPAATTTIRAATASSSSARPRGARAGARSCGRRAARCATSSSTAPAASARRSPRVLLSQGISVRMIEAVARAGAPRRRGAPEGAGLPRDRVRPGLPRARAHRAGAGRRSSRCATTRRTSTRRRSPRCRASRSPIAIAHEAVSVERFDKAGIDVAVNPRAVTAEEIVRFAHDPRTQQVAMLEGNRYEVLDVTTRESSRYIGMAFRDMPVHGSIIGAIVRNGAAIFPHGDDVLAGRRPRDHLHRGRERAVGRRGAVSSERQAVARIGRPRRLGDRRRGGRRISSGRSAKYLGLAALFPIAVRARLRRAGLALPRRRRRHERRRARARAAHGGARRTRRRARGLPRRRRSTWLLAAAFASLPYLFDGGEQLASPLDAYFEGMSGVHDDRRERRHRLSTRSTARSRCGGSSRSGSAGMGIIVLAVAVLPRLRVGGRQLMESELPGPEIARARRAHPRDRAEALGSSTSRSPSLLTLILALARLARASTT